ncbi:tetratricopeptide repeat protein [Candidatus Poribacteria bacterium]|nr:tetratricopeptide repeat protein [Candidatus Poribacteria bacterium]
MPTSNAPSGHITLVFTDIEDSSRMATALGDTAYGEEIRQLHNARIRESLAGHNGYEVKTIGDSFMIAFQSADDALACVCDIQRRLTDPRIAATDRDGTTWICQVRIGVHTTETQLHPDPSGDYHGGDVNFAARVESLGVGCQVLVSANTHRVADEKPHEWMSWEGRRIRSFADPETVYELLWDGKSRGEPGSGWFPGWYFGEPNAYVERPAKQDDVFRAFEDHRLVTLRADGGMGKTRLAVFCASRLAGRFEHGVYLVPLEDATPTAHGVAESCSTALGIEGATPDELVAGLADREILLLMDNYEAVAEAGDEVATFLASLIRNTRAVRLLVTGRSLAGVAGLEKEIGLDDGMTDAETRELFLERSRLHGNRSDWTPDADDEGWLARLFDLTLRIPLAVELAAAWMGDQSLQEIVEELDAKPLGSAAALPSGSVSLNDTGRHRSLTRCFDFTYDKLDGLTQQGFAALGVFAGTIAVESAAAVCALETPEARDLLLRLSRFSLLRRLERKGESRWSMHRFVREYANSKRVTDEPELRYVAHFTRIATENGGAEPPNDESRRAVLDAEFANIVYAAETAERLCDWEAVQTLSSQTTVFCDLRSAWTAQRTLNERALRAAREEGVPGNEGAALGNLGVVYELQGRWQEAEGCYDQSLAIFKGLGDRHGEGQTLNNLGIVYRLQGKWQEAERCYDQSLAIKRELGHRHGEAQTLSNLGIAYEQQGKWQEAEGCYDQSLAILRELGDRHGEGQTLYNLALLREAQGDVSAALEVVRDALSVLETTEDTMSRDKAHAMIARWERA